MNKPETLTLYGDHEHILVGVPIEETAALRFLETHGVDRDYRNGDVHYRHGVGTRDYVRWHHAAPTCIRCKNANWIMIGHSCGKAN